MKLSDVGRQLETYVPHRYAESWDNVGWMVGQLEQELRGALVCVDVTRTVLDHALSSDLNLILAHHPLIFDSLKQVVDREPVQRLVMKAIQNDQAIYTMHTNADSMPGGLNDLFADVLELTQTSPIRPDETEPRAGLGRIGMLDRTMSLEQIETTLVDALDISHFQTLGKPDTEVTRVAVCTGSGGDFIGPDLADQVDLYITGDVGHHNALDAQGLDLPLIMLDHYEMETVFLGFAETLWKEQFGEQFPVERFRRENPYRFRT